MSFKLEWENSVNSQFQTIHRANEPFGADALPPVYAMVDKGVSDFTDTAIEAFTPYFYRVASNRIVKGISEVVASRLVSGGFMGGPSLDLDFSGRAFAVMQPSGAMLGKNFGDIITFTRSTGGGRFNAQGQYEWLPANTPRIDYDPVTGECRGLLIEEQRTNLLTYSSDFANAVWTKGGATITPDATTSLDGGLNADKLVESANNSSHTIARFPIPLTIGAAYTFSIFAKAAERRIFRMTGGVGLPFEATVSLIDGTVTGSAGAITVSTYGNGWWRISGAATAASASADIYMATRITTGGGGSAYLGDGTSGLYIWGAQLEAGSFPTSYIPTTDAQVTRAADIATVNELSPWYRQGEGTLFVEASASSPGGPSGGVAATIGDGTSSNYMYFGWRTPTAVRRAMTVRADGAEQAGLDTATNTPTGTYKIAGAYTANDFAATINGAVPASDTSGSVPAVSSLAIGRLTSGLHWNGHIRVLRYFPRRLSNSELQALTA